MDSPV